MEFAKGANMRPPGEIQYSPWGLIYSGASIAIHDYHMRPIFVKIRTTLVIKKGGCHESEKGNDQSNSRYWVSNPDRS
jgi:hypothetical protein